MIKNINGLDCYFFVRFLRMMVRVMLPIWLLSWAVLLPLTSVHTSVAGNTGLNKFIFGNVAPTEQARYEGQLIVTWILTSKSRSSPHTFVMTLNIFSRRSMDMVEYQI
jgi:calcium permeable stress-gated cation channel